ncbi:hypothetical protein NST62_11595 [Ureibacillus sp. FSL K6-8385]|uniref:DUF4083 domain-containing protein n=1 Tax=Ureibacillus terrenus TaxID=118246 RepID=A0A540V3E0_9BACL|nr:hypothetical protein [Ureibacillus terrenus]MED3763850.1 hypothetical protein [Ureibacillus terrenus]TQE91256.1 hypothetical protein FKZ59_06335 [Ureibacillus terrenus]
MMLFGATVGNVGDVLAAIFLLGFIIIMIMIGALLLNMYKKNKKRLEELIMLEKQQNIILKNRADDINERLSRIERLLKEKN